MPNKKIALVDDEEDFREITVKFFLRRKIQCLEAENCTAILDLLARRAEELDVIIMDISMPGKNGIDCMAEIKKCWPQKEIIILTGHTSLNTSISGMKQGAFDYCMKPVEYEELLEKVMLAQEAVKQQHEERDEF